MIAHSQTHLCCIRYNLISALRRVGVYYESQTGLLVPSAAVLQQEFRKAARARKAADRLRCSQPFQVSKTFITARDFRKIAEYIRAGMNRLVNAPRPLSSRDAREVHRKTLTACFCVCPTQRNQASTPHFVFTASLSLSLSLLLSLSRSLSFLQGMFGVNPDSVFLVCRLCLRFV